MAIDPMWFLVGAYVVAAIAVAVLLGLYFRK